MLINCRQVHVGMPPPHGSVGERRYHLQTRYPIFEVLPKRESVFATRFLETGEGVATASPASLRVPALILRFFTLSRRSFSLRCWVMAVRVAPAPGGVQTACLEVLQHLIQRLTGGLRGAQGLKGCRELIFHGGVRLPAVGFQVPVEGPDLLLRPLNRPPVQLI